MNTTNVVTLRPVAVPRQLGCSACGATADASCDCGASYLPAGQRAAEAVAANPEKSNRAIAAEIGVDHKTVGSARRSGGDHSPPEEKRRIGQDGKSYPAKSTKAAREKAYEARLDKDNLKTAKSMTEAFIAAGKMSDQQIADFRERGIIPPFRLFSPCGMAFDGGAPYAQASCDPTPVDDEPKKVREPRDILNNSGVLATVAEGAEAEDTKELFMELAARAEGVAFHDFSKLIVDGQILTAAHEVAYSWSLFLDMLKASHAARCDNIAAARARGETAPLM
jgi:hypothetical protein